MGYGKKHLKFYFSFSFSYFSISHLHGTHFSFIFQQFYCSWPKVTRGTGGSGSIANNKQNLHFHPSHWHWHTSLAPRSATPPFGAPLAVVLTLLFHHIFHCILRGACFSNMFVLRTLPSHRTKVENSNLLPAACGKIFAILWAILQNICFIIKHYFWIAGKCQA